MSSSINPFNINGNYPVAGQDNDSQGFRDNFTNIRNNLSFAKSELEDLQNKVVLKSALSGTTLSNDFGGSQIIAPQLRGWTQSVVDQGTVGGSVAIDFNYGNFQKITPNDDVTLAFDNWPGLTGAGAIGYAILRLWVVINNTSYGITLPAEVTTGVDDIAGYNTGTNTLTFDQTGIYVFDISSGDGGDTFLIEDVTRNKSTLRGATTEVSGNITVGGTGSVTGNVTLAKNATVSGNLITGGGQVVTGYQYVVAANAATTTANITASRVIMDPAATIAVHTVTLPAGAADGQIISVHSTAQITALTVDSATGTVKPSTAFQLDAGTGAEFFWHSSETTWYKIR